jgi:hypothetical protein
MVPMSMTSDRSLSNDRNDIGRFHNGFPLTDSPDCHRRFQGGNESARRRFNGPAIHPDMDETYGRYYQSSNFRDPDSCRVLRGDDLACACEDYLHIRERLVRHGMQRDQSQRRRISGPGGLPGMD